jgi:hypothetical protein
MGFPVAPGTVDLSSTGTIQHIPEIWAPKFAVRFYPTTFMSSVTNTDYQGSLQKMGDKVKIRVKPTVATFKYTKNMDISKKNTATFLDSIEFPIERGIGWRVPVNKVDQKQADVDYLGELMAEGALSSKVDIETEFLAEYYTEAAAYNHGQYAGKKSSQNGTVNNGYNIGYVGGPVGIDQTNALTFLMMLQAVGTEARMPAAGRFAILPVWYAYYLGISDLKNASFSGLGTSTVLSGKIPDQMAGFQLFVTDLYTETTDSGHACTPLLFGHRSVNTFAAQLSVLETVPTITDYGTTVQALTIYDWKCVNGDGLGYGWVYKA